MAPFTLITIPTLPTDVMIQDKELGFCFEAFRCTGQRDPYKAFRGTMKFSKQFSTNFYALPQEERNLVGRYLLHYMDRGQHSLEDLVNLLSSNPQEKETIMTSIAQALKQEGRQEGIQKGRQEGETIGIQKGAHDKALHIARNMLSKLHLGINEVKKATGLSEEELMKLQEAGKEK